MIFKSVCPRAFSDIAREVKKMQKRLERKSPLALKALLESRKGKHVGMEFVTNEDESISDFSSLTASEKLNNTEVKLALEALLELGSRKGKHVGMEIDKKEDNNIGTDFSRADSEKLINVDDKSLTDSEKSNNANVEFTPEALSNLAKGPFRDLAREVEKTQKRIEREAPKPSKSFNNNEIIAI